MSRDNQFKEPDAEIPQEEQAERIRFTRLWNAVLTETKSSILDQIKIEEGKPYDERIPSWNILLEEVIRKTIKKFPEIPFEKSSDWYIKIKEYFPKTEKEFLIEQGKYIREGHEPTIERGMYSNKIR